MNIRSNKIVALLASLLLVACVETTATTQTAARSASAGPGTVTADSSEAGELFARVCLQTRPDFAEAKAVIATLPFTQNSRTGTYYHNRLNLSFKILNDAGRPVCSLVFGTRDEGSRSFEKFVAAASRLTTLGPQSDVTFVVAAASGGVTYISVKAVVQ